MRPGRKRERDDMKKVKPRTRGSFIDSTMVRRLTRDGGLMCSLLKTGSRSHVVCLRRTRAKSSSDMVGLLPEYWSKWRPSVKELITTTAHLEVTFCRALWREISGFESLVYFCREGII